MTHPTKKIQVAIAVLLVLVGTTYASTTHAIFGVGDITLVDIQHDIIDELPVIIETTILTAVNDAANAALKATLAPRKISDHTNYAINLTNDVYVDRALATSGDSNTALTKTLIAQQQGLATTGGVNTGQIAQQRALTAFNPYSVNPQVGNANASIVDVMAPAVNPNADLSYQQSAMSQNAAAVLGKATSGASKDIAAGQGSKSSYSGTAGNLSVASAGKEVDSALDSIVQSAFGAQQKPQDEFSAILLALSKSFIAEASQALTGSSAGTPVSTTPKAVNVTLGNGSGG